MKKYITILFTLLSVVAFGQIENTITIKGITTNISEFETTTRLADVNINVYEFNTQLATHQVSTKGKFEFTIPKNSYIVIEFVKDDYITKRVWFDTRTTAKTIPTKPFDLEVVLLKHVKGVDYSDLDFPITRVEYNEELNDFDYVPEYTKMMMKKQEEVLAKLQEESMDKLVVK